MLADVRELLNVQFFPFNFAVKKCRGFLRRDEAVIEAREEGSDIRDHGLAGENAGILVTRALHLWLPIQRTQSDEFQSEYGLHLRVVPVT